MTWHMDFRSGVYRLLGTELGVKRVRKDTWVIFQGPYHISFHTTLREAKAVAQQMDLQEQLQQAKLRDEGSHGGDAPLSAG